MRSIKWLRRIVASAEEADGVWQRGMAYKSFGPDITSLDNIDIAKYAPIQEMPVQSAIFSPLPNAKCVDGAGSTIDVKGFAWSGGGRGIARVDVSADGGQMFTPTVCSSSLSRSGRSSVPGGVSGSLVSDI